MITIYLATACIRIEHLKIRGTEEVPLIKLAISTEAFLRLGRLSSLFFFFFKMGRLTDEKEGEECDSQK